MSIHNDDFDDNDLDTTYWAKLIMVPGQQTVLEQNQRLECNSPFDAGATFDTACGIVTQDAYDLTEVDITAEYNLNTIYELVLAIALTKTINSKPWDEDDVYSVSVNQTQNTVYARRRVAGGAEVELASAVHTATIGTLRICILNGTIYLYIDGILLYSEAYALGSYTCYVYLFGFTWGAAPPLSDYGIGYFLSFAASQNSAATKGALMLLHTP